MGIFKWFGFRRKDKNAKDESKPSPLKEWPRPEGDRLPWETAPVKPEQRKPVVRLEPGREKQQLNKTVVKPDHEKEEQQLKDIKEMILWEARRLVDEYRIDAKHYRDMEGFERYVRNTPITSTNDGEFICLRNGGGYSYQNWERGKCNFGFDGKDEEQFVQLFLGNRFFENCVRCCNGHYLRIDFDKQEEMVRCTDIMTGRCAWGKNQRVAEAAMMRAIYEMPQNPGMICGSDLIWPTPREEPAETELRLPKKLFVVRRREDMDAGDNVHSQTETLVMQSAGRLVLEIGEITYSAHNIAHNTGLFTIKKEVSFEKLNLYIGMSDDPEAKKYTGMNADNWRKYVETPVKYPDPTKYPLLPFGKYRQQTGTTAMEEIWWYVLDMDEDRTALLLAEKGLDAQLWHGTKEPVEWKDCDLYSWLNSYFAAAAFSGKERAALRKTSGGGMVTVLSKAEAERYLKGDGAVCAVPTDYAKSRGASAKDYSEDHRKYEGNGIYWLRDAKVEQFGPCATAVYWDGSFCEYTHGGKMFTMVRPVIRLDLEKAFGKQKADSLYKEYMRGIRKL